MKAKLTAIAIIFLLIGAGGKVDSSDPCVKKCDNSAEKCQKEDCHGNPSDCFMHCARLYRDCIEACHR